MKKRALRTIMLASTLAAGGLVLATKAILDNVQKEKEKDCHCCDCGLTDDDLEEFISEDDYYDEYDEDCDEDGDDCYDEKPSKTETPEEKAAGEFKKHIMSKQEQYEFTRSALEELKADNDEAESISKKIEMKEENGEDASSDKQYYASIMNRIKHTIDILQSNSASELKEANESIEADKKKQMQEEFDSKRSAIIKEAKDLTKSAIEIAKDALNYIGSTVEQQVKKGV